jgi:hypothetical protein
LALVPEEPAVATVVATVTPVVLEFIDTIPPPPPVLYLPIPDEATMVSFVVCV